MSSAPVLADAMYGKRSRDPRIRDAEEAIGRQALHARLLGFEHPVTGETIRAEAPTPPDFEAALSRLR